MALIDRNVVGRLRERRAERRLARRPDDAAQAKLAAIRKAATYRFPMPDVDTLLAEMEASRLAEIEAGMPGAGDV